MLQFFRLAPPTHYPFFIAHYTLLEISKGGLTLATTDKTKLCLGQHDLSFVRQLKIIFVMAQMFQILPLLLLFSLLVKMTEQSSQNNQQTGCTNCEARLSEFCCATAWNGICCEFPMRQVRSNSDKLTRWCQCGSSEMTSKTSIVTLQKPTCWSSFKNDPAFRNHDFQTRSICTFSAAIPVN